MLLNYIYQLIENYITSTCKSLCLCAETYQFKPVCRFLNLKNFQPLAIY